MKKKIIEFDRSIPMEYVFKQLQDFLVNHNILNGPHSPYPRSDGHLLIEIVEEE